ncbi:MAG TPA: ABC transporter ATP-binding protein [Candidatus Saccharimonadales bacterium]
MNSAQKTFRFYLGHIRRFPRYAVPSFLLLPINIIVNNYLPPLVLAVILHRLSTGDYQDGEVWASFGGELVLYLVLALLGGTVLWRLFDAFYWRLEGHVVRSISKQVFSKLIHESSTFHANEFGGSLVSATNKLTGAYVRITDTTMFAVAPLFVGLIFVSIVMFSRSWLYTVILVGFSLFYIAVSFYATRSVRERGRLLATTESKQTGVLADAITNVMAIKSFARERYEEQRFARATDKTYSGLISMMNAFQRQQLFLGSVTGVLSAASLVAAVVSVVMFDANIATAFLIFNYTSAIVSQLFQFSNNALRNYNRAIGDAGDMIDILERVPEVLDPAKPEKVKMPNGHVEFKDVTFTHNGSDDALFSHLDLDIKPGEKIGLVGHSGSGKTTFTRILLRFSDIDSGEVLVDGQNIAHVTQDDLHTRISYVPQEPLLFHRSIRENIAYGDPKATDAQVRWAAQQAHAADFIEQLPDGYETLVGERGVKLSGGQRQRIAIARAMLKKAPILVLDEATSALDSESEVLIQDALWKLMEGRTAIVIAHRLSTIQKMDRIIVMDNGAIAEQGSHAQLLKKKGTYAKLWAHQSGGFIDD